VPYSRCPLDPDATPKPRKKVYLAGPDVFLPNAVEIGAIKKQMCDDLRFEGLFPLDNAETGADAAVRIFPANCALMESADFGLFNLTPFRGASADVGTAFEVGFLYHRRKPLFGYTSKAGTYADRVASSAGPGAPRGLHDQDQLAIENFGLFDNLMIARAIQESGGLLTTVEEEGDARRQLAALGAFSASLKALAQRFPQMGVGTTANTGREGRP